MDVHKCKTYNYLLFGSGVEDLQFSFPFYFFTLVVGKGKVVLLRCAAQRAAFQLLNPPVDVKVAFFNVFDCALFWLLLLLRLRVRRWCSISNGEAIGISNGKKAEFIFVAEGQQVGSLFVGPVLVAEKGLVFFPSVARDAELEVELLKGQCFADLLRFLYPAVDAKRILGKSERRVAERTFDPIAAHPVKGGSEECSAVGKSKGDLYRAKSCALNTISTNSKQ